MIIESNGVFQVPSHSKEKLFYKVSNKGNEFKCDCEAFTRGLRNPCKHILEVRMHIRHKIKF